MSVIETKYSDFKERQSKRKKAVYFLFFFLIVSIIFGIYLFFESVLFYYVWMSIAMFGVLLWFFFVTTRSWFPEMVETKIFVNFYEASNRLKLCSKKDERLQLNLETAHEKAKNATLILKRFASKLSIESHSRLIKTEIAEPLKLLVKNLETRILPRILQRDNVSEMRDVLFVLADYFGETYRTLNLNYVISQNKDLEKKYEPIEVEEPISRFRTILSMQHVKISLSIIIALIATSPLLVIYSLWFGNLIEAFTSIEALFAYVGLLLLVVKEAIYPYINKKFNPFE